MGISQKLLAAAVCLVTATPFAHASTLSNGNFDQVDDTVGTWNNQKMSNLCNGPGSSWDVYNSLPGGWNALTSPGIELQTDRTLGTIDAHSGCHYVELDSHPSPGDTTMQQEFNLGPGSYALSFFYSPRTSDVGSMGVEYSITDSLMNALVAGGITGPSLTDGTEVGKWTEVRAGFSLDVETTLKLTFFAEADRNTLGGLIDTVSIQAVPLPASSLLLLGGLGGLAAVRRRKK